MTRKALCLLAAVGGLYGCAAPAPPYYGSPYGAYSPQPRIQGAQAVPQTPPTAQPPQMQFGPAGSSTPAEYHYGPDESGAVSPAGGAEFQSPQSSVSPTGHAPDYSWIRGRLERSHIGGGAWIVRYADVSANDPYGGAVVLQGIDPSRLGLRPGDAVIVHGSIVENTTFPYLPNPGYRVTNIRRAGP